MRKPQIQPALASLSGADRLQLAELLRHGEYEDVRARVNQPRPEGFGLNLASVKPLQTFYAKVGMLDLINARLPESKKISLSTFESLAQCDIDFLISADPAVIADAHGAILNATHKLANSDGTTPAQLRTLQTLADFPARAELRAERHEILLAREDRAQAREERAAAKAERDAQ
ncbi:MAG TPA: hypothetical protein VF773_05215, partial [Verrucomicrobiae bacterium]